jgi:hypothetical protein
VCTGCSAASLHKAHRVWCLLNTKPAKAGQSRQERLDFQRQMCGMTGDHRRPQATLHVANLVRTPLPARQKHRTPHKTGTDQPTNNAPHTLVKPGASDLAAGATSMSEISAGPASPHQLAPPHITPGLTWYGTLCNSCAHKPSSKLAGGGTHPHTRIASTTTKSRHTTVQAAPKRSCVRNTGSTAAVSSGVECHT